MTHLVTVLFGAPDMSGMGIWLFLSVASVAVFAMCLTAARVDRKPREITRIVPETIPQRRGSLHQRPGQLVCCANRTG